MANNKPKSERLMSLDVLRGFDMFFIMGGQGIILGLCTLCPGWFSDVVKNQMDHVQWNGFAFYDMIFPLFLFLAGVSFPFSLSKSRSKGLSERKIYRQVIQRGIVLVLLGFVYNGFFGLTFAELRYASVLGRIGLAWMFAAIIFMNVNTRWRIWITAGILLFYWALLGLFPAPDISGYGRYTFEGNLVGYIDRLFLPGHLYDKTFDPEGILSTIPAICTALLGMFAGELVKKEDKSGNNKAFMLAAIGTGLVVLGLIWNFGMPINKKLWSSSYVCFVGGLSFMLFALFYYIIDVRKFQKWVFFFSVIGMNSITIYLGQRIINFNTIGNFFCRGLVESSPAIVQPLISSIFFVAASWLFLYFLYRQKVFLRV
ncbi:MAG: DUF5009 domain-containing protein [Bacteroidales bacterium]|jgi:predicted acyltransferase|nr:DUF5009 domain-containing protein [Bacteroidales bacterium]